MGGKGLELDANFQLKKCIWGVDRISQLPDDILVDILSFLPLKEAGATSLVSRRWSHLWKYTPNLVLIPKKPKKPKPKPRKRMCPFLARSLMDIEWVNSVLNLHKAVSLKQFTIFLHLDPDSPYRQPLTKWLHFAFSRRVESLTLEFRLMRNILDNNLLSSVQSTNYKFLKEVTLKRLGVSGEAIQWFLRNCPLLEQFIIRGTVTTTTSESDIIVVERVNFLKYLDIHDHLDGCKVSIKVVSAPNLTRFDCNYDLGKLLLENVPNLVHASFVLAGARKAMHHLHQFANAAPKLETLSMLLHAPLSFSVPQMPKLNKLSLYYATVNEGFPLPVTRLLQASPCLQEFRLTIGHALHMFYDRRNPPPICYFEVPKTGRFPHHHLNVFEFNGFFPGTAAADQMELMSYIVNNCVALEEIIIFPIPEKRGDTSAPNVKKCTEQRLAALNLPHNVKLRIDVSPSRIAAAAAI